MGEQARSKGSEAEAKAWKFIQSLGYRIEDKNNEDYDIDSLAVFPPKTAKNELIRPRYSPEGLTAFEVTEETLRKKKVTDFRDKIADYNADNPQEPIMGGILLIDQNISPKMIEYMRSEGIWGWGRSRQRLYKEKWGTFHEWNEELGATSEIALDNLCSYLLCSTPPPTKFDKLLYFAVFSDDDFHTMSIKKITEILDRIKNDSISPLVKIGITPINIHIEFHSVGGRSATEEDFENEIVKFWATEGINIRTPRHVFSDYRTFSSF